MKGSGVSMRSSARKAPRPQGWILALAFSTENLTSAAVNGASRPPSGAAASATRFPAVWAPASRAPAATAPAMVSTCP